MIRKSLTVSLLSAFLFQCFLLFFDSTVASTLHFVCTLGLSDNRFCKEEKVFLDLCKRQLSLRGSISFTGVHIIFTHSRNYTQYKFKFNVTSDASDGILIIEVHLRILIYVCYIFSKESYRESPHNCHRHHSFMLDELRMNSKIIQDL